MSSEIENPNVSEGLDTRDFHILELIDENGPIGAWSLKAQLSKKEIDISFATIGRRLSHFDAIGYTVQDSNKGRITTSAAKRYIKQVRYDMEHEVLSRRIVESVSATKYVQLVDLYCVRRGLETEATYFAALRATDEELRELRVNTMQYEECMERGEDALDVSLEFHSIIARICHNEFLTNVLELILSENKFYEHNVDNIPIENRRTAYILEHKEIMDALEKRDARGASEAMYKHLSTIINDELSHIKGMDISK